MFLIVNIVGIGRQSGKTLVIQKLEHEFTRKHYNVSTINHIFEGSFDTAHKDTWKYLNAGATPVIAISSNELVTINKKAIPQLKMLYMRYQILFKPYLSRDSRTQDTLRSSSQEAYTMLINY